MVANAMSSGTLNHKLDSLLFTYSMTLDFLPGPSLSLRTGLRPAPPQDLSIWKETSSHWVSPFPVLTCVRTSDWGIRKGITWVDAQKGLDWDTRMVLR